MVKGKGARKPMGQPPRPAKKLKPISYYWRATPGGQGLEDSGSCSPSHADEPTPRADAATGARSRARPPQTSLHTTAGAGHQVKTAVLKSLNRRLVQQTLQTPFAGASGSFESNAMGEEAAAADDFVLYSSQTYERVLSQQILCDAGPGTSGTQDGLTQTQFLPDPVQQPSQRYPAQAQVAQPSSSAASQELDEDVPRRVSNASTCSARATPGMRTDDEASCSAGPARLFPVFRTWKERKVLHVIRHGESEYNAACNGPNWADPVIFDAPLTKKGKEQAMSLRRQLVAMDLPTDVLWVTSPLSRAVQTLMYACPALQISGAQPKIVVRSEITELLATTGDVGHPSSVLAARFPELAEQFAALPEVWWHSSPTKPNCALTGELRSLEPRMKLKRRIEEFTKWVLSRPEKVIVAVGHSLFWRDFLKPHLGESSTMKNCELRTLRF